ncbi:DUF5753 domain-containing protein [Nocardia sp. NPDC056000]|uniref:DUF5753 domain-containing protein n=1 Tax=Nocardia sp. NPDC056000 TaxID=3345674 RepID=UPI0035E21409
MDFGNFMHELRLRSPRPSMTSAALHVETTRQVIDRLEQGSPTKLVTLHINGLLDFYAADPEARAQALRLWAEVQEQDKTARAQGNSKGFWKAYSDQVAPNFEKFLRLEGAADEIVAYQPTLVPGLLQLPDYRRAITHISEPDLSPVDVERLLELTRKRQVRLNDNNFRLIAFLSEAALRHKPASPAVMAAQLRWLGEVGERENVDLHVIPFSSGPHLGMTMQTFTLLRFPKGASGLSLPQIVYAEGAIGSTFHEHNEEVGQYRKAVASLRTVALTQVATRDLVLTVAKEYAA